MATPASPASASPVVDHRNKITVIMTDGKVLLADAFDPLDLEAGQTGISIRVYNRIAIPSLIPYSPNYGWAAGAFQATFSRQEIKTWAMPSQSTNWPVELTCQLEYFEQISFRGLLRSDQFHRELWKAESCETIHVSALEGDFFRLSKAIFLEGSLAKASGLGDKNLYFSEVYYRKSPYVEVR